jgi:hypothetical protein
MDKDELIKLMKRTLKARGFIVSETEEMAELLDDALSRADQFILGFCHISEIPEGLVYARTDIACGYFLQNLYNTGQLDELYGIETGVSSLKIGDTQVNYNEDSASANARVTAMIDDLLNGKRGDLLRYRRICW